MRSSRQHEIAELILRSRKPIAFDAFSEIASTGRFVIVDGCDVVGGGIVQAGGGTVSRLGAEVARPRTRGPERTRRAACSG